VLELVRPTALGLLAPHEVEVQVEDLLPVLD
jgi:hypothetical protein